MRHLIIMTTALVLAACNNASQKPAANPAKYTKQNIAEGTAEAQKPPQAFVHNINGNQLIVMTVKTVDSMGIVSERPCFVWRDAQYGSSAMSCDKDSQTTVPLPE